MSRSCTRAREEPQVVEGQVAGGGRQQVRLELGNNKHLLRLWQAGVLHGGVVEVGRHRIDSDLIVAVVILACIEGTLPLE